jgi:hypothetical protein
MSQFLFFDTERIRLSLFPQHSVHERPADGFATQKDSESWGVEFGRKWINDGKPDFTSPADI